MTEREIAEYVRFAVLGQAEALDEQHAVKSAARWAIETDNIARLADRSKRDPVAFEAMSAVMDNLRERGQSIPDDLLRAAADGIRRGKPRRKGRRPKTIENATIALAAHVAHGRGMPLYKGGEATGRTACGLVSELLQEYGIYKSEEVVKQIVADHRRRLGSKTPT